MINDLTQYHQHLLFHGISLKNFGADEVGLKRDDALKLIEILGYSDVPILGGDVYFKRGEVIELAYANWFTDPESGESRNAYVRRSLSVARSYIEAFPVQIAVEPLFVIVAQIC